MHSQGDRHRRGEEEDHHRRQQPDRRRANAPFDHLAVEHPPQRTDREDGGRKHVRQVLNERGGKTFDCRQAAALEQHRLGGLREERTGEGEELDRFAGKADPDGVAKGKSVRARDRRCQRQRAHGLIHRVRRRDRHRAPPDAAEHLEDGGGAEVEKEVDEEREAGEKEEGPGQGAGC